VNEYWDASKHDPADKYWGEEEQVWMARNQMQWFLAIVSPSPRAILGKFEEEVEHRADRKYPGT
jgi:hypothetical protein